MPSTSSSAPPSPPAATTSHTVGTVHVKAAPDWSANTIATSDAVWGDLRALRLDVD